MTYEQIIYAEGFGAGLVVMFLITVGFFLLKSNTKSLQVRIAGLWRKHLWTNDGTKVWILKAVDLGVRIIDEKGKTSFWTWKEAVQNLTGQYQDWALIHYETQKARNQFDLNKVKDNL